MLVRAQIYGIQPLPDILEKKIFHAWYKNKEVKTINQIHSKIERR